MTKNTTVLHKVGCGFAAVLVPLLGVLLVALFSEGEGTVNIQIIPRMTFNGRTATATKRISLAGRYHLLHGPVFVSVSSTEKDWRPFDFKVVVTDSESGVILVETSASKDTLAETNWYEPKRSFSSGGDFSKIENKTVDFSVTLQRPADEAGPTSVAVSLRGFARPWTRLRRWFGRAPDP